MKNLLSNTALTLILSGSMLLSSGCTSSFDDLNTNPDATTKVNSSMLATGIILNMVKSSSYWKNEFLAKRMFWGEQMDDIQYNRFGRSDFSEIQSLISAQKMMELSTDIYKDAYTGLFYFMKGWYFWRATMETGDIPYSEALDIDNFPLPQIRRTERRIQERLVRPGSGR